MAAEEGEVGKEKRKEGLSSTNEGLRVELSKEGLSLRKRDSWESFKLLGIIDVQKTPCARESILYGTVGSLVIGLGHFLATSRVRRSCDFAVGGFILTTLGCWVHCRYNNAKLRIQQKMLQEGIKNKILFEGSSLDPNMDKNKTDSKT